MPCVSAPTMVCSHSIISIFALFYFRHYLICVISSHLRKCTYLNTHNCTELSSLISCPCGTFKNIAHHLGSLSARVMSFWGDSPKGMVESAIEFAKICRKLDYHNFLFSMKVCPQIYSLLCVSLHEKLLHNHVILPSISFLHFICLMIGIQSLSHGTGLSSSRTRNVQSRYVRHSCHQTAFFLSLIYILLLPFIATFCFAF